MHVDGSGGDDDQLIVRQRAGGMSPSIGKGFEFSGQMIQERPVNRQLQQRSHRRVPPFSGVLGVLLFCDFLPIFLGFPFIIAEICRNARRNTGIFQIRKQYGQGNTEKRQTAIFPVFENF